MITYRKLNATGFECFKLIKTNKKQAYALETVVVDYYPLCPKLFTVNIVTKVIWFSHTDSRSIPGFSGKKKKKKTRKRTDYSKICLFTKLKNTSIC